MPPQPPSTTRTLKHIYLIVATTPVSTPTGPRLGIGLNGSLPWPMIKSDMTYFRKVTTDGRDVSSKAQHPSLWKESGKLANSVVMGRKTYESIPGKLRPLNGRRNYVVTRGDVGGLAERYRGELVEQSEKAMERTRERQEKEKKEKDEPGSDAKTIKKTSPETRDLQLMNANFVTVVNSEGEARVTSSNDAILPITITASLTQAINDCDGNDRGGIYCIGGAEIYKLLLQDQSLRPRLRVLQTEVQKLMEGEEFECDTFWPEELKESVDGWSEVDGETVVGWTGIELPQGKEEWTVNEEVGVRLRVRGWMQGG